MKRNKPLPQFDQPAPPIKFKVPAPVSYHLYVRPKPPRVNIGMLALPKRTQNAELAMRTIGQVIALGAAAYRARIGYFDPTLDPIGQSIKEGTWVHYRQHAGQKIKVRGESDATSEFDEDSTNYILALADTDILGVFDDEAHADAYFDWT